MRQRVDGQQVTEVMREAYRVAMYSPDPSTQNGAVLVDRNFNILASGCNDFPFGVSTEHWHGDKEPKYARVVHAEVAALLDAARRGVSTVGTYLVCPWAACSNCSKHIAEAGVSRLIRHKFANNGVTTGNHWYDDCILGDEIMREGGVAITEVEAVGWSGKLRRNGELWTPGQ